jgi:hypothetical protein
LGSGSRTYITVVEGDVHYLSIFSTIISFAFAISVFNRYRERKGTHLLLWGFGLVLYGLGTLTEVILSFTFSELALKVWYLSGAMLTAAWLGQGTVHLLVRKRGVASSLTIILTIVSILAAVLVFIAPLTAAVDAFDPGVPVSSQYKAIMTRSSLTIALTVLLNIYGTITLVGGAIYSAYLFWRKKVLLNRMVGNILIAAGALLPAMGGTFIQAGLVDWLYLSEFLGVILMYAGFIQATAKPAVESNPAVTAS